MKKSWIILIVTLFLLLSLGFPVWAEDEPTLDDPSLDETLQIPNTFSIGVNSLPWYASGFSLRWWKSEGVGREFKFGTIWGEVGNYKSSYDEYQNSTYSLPGVRYDWLHRELINPQNNLYYIWGQGIGFSYYTTRNVSSVRDEASLSYFIPLGIENFCLEKYPYLSYSIQADIYGRLQYLSTTPTSGGYSITSSTFSFGVVPCFYLHYYLK